MLHEGRGTRHQQLGIACEITLGRIQQLSGLALVEKQAVNVETFINQRRLPGIDRHGPLCQRQHFQVSGKNDIGNRNAAQGLTKREAGFRHRRHALQKLPVGGFPKHDGHEAVDARKPVISAPEAGQRHPRPTRKQGQHPPANGGVRQIMREIKDMGHAGVPVAFMRRRRCGLRFGSKNSQLRAQAMDSGNWHLSPSAVKANRSTIICVAPE